MSTDTIFDTIRDTNDTSIYGHRELKTFDPQERVVEQYKSLDFEKKVDIANQLISEYKSQKEKYSYHIDGVEQNSDAAFSRVIDDFLSVFISVGLRSSNIGVSLTNSPSMVFYVRNYLDFSKIRYEIFVEDDEEYVAFSIYKNAELFARSAGNHTEAFKIFKKILSKPDRFFVLGSKEEKEKYKDSTISFID